MYCTTVEYKPLNLPTESTELRAWLDKNSTQQIPETLGLHKTIDGYKPGNFIGLVRLGETADTILQVNPKFQEMDYLAMYLRCTADAITREHLEHCVTLFPESPPIKTEVAPEFCIFMVATFLQALNVLCRRHLRRHFYRQDENLTGKVKGKIMLAENLQRNVAHGRAERVYCSYQTISNDILENRLLLVALERSAKYLARSEKLADTNVAALRRWIVASRAALRGVPTLAVAPQDFTAARTRGAFAVYRRPLELAKAVLFSLGFNPQSELQPPTQVMPFAINSAELFERFAECELRKAFPGLKAGYGGGRGSGFSGDRKGFKVTIRPDFWVPKTENGDACIIDAKYKKLKSDDVNGTLKPARNDIFQMIAYSRHKNFIQNKLDDQDSDKITAQLCYPCFDSSKRLYLKDQSFFADLEIFLIRCPTLAERKISTVKEIAA